MCVLFLTHKMSALAVYALVGIIIICMRIFIARAECVLKPFFDLNNVNLTANYNGMEIDLMTCAEPSTVSFSFRLSNDCPEKCSIYVRKNLTSICTLETENKRCLPEGNRYCSCNQREDGAVFTLKRNVTLVDSASWSWTIQAENPIFVKKIRFEIRGKNQGLSTATLQIREGGTESTSEGTYVSSSFNATSLRTSPLLQRSSLSVDLNTILQFSGLVFVAVALIAVIVTIRKQGHKRNARLSATMNDFQTYDFSHNNLKRQQKRKRTTKRFTFSFSYSRKREQKNKPGKRKPTNHRLALPDNPSCMPSPNSYDLIDDSHISAVTYPQATPLNIDTRPPAPLPHKIFDYFRSIPAEEDIFATVGEMKDQINRLDVPDESAVFQTAPKRCMNKRNHCKRWRHPDELKISEIKKTGIKASKPSLMHTLFGSRKHSQRAMPSLHRSVSDCRQTEDCSSDRDSVAEKIVIQPAIARKKFEIRQTTSHVSRFASLDEFTCFNEKVITNGETKQKRRGTNITPTQVVTKHPMQHCTDSKLILSNSNLPLPDRNCQQHIYPSSENAVSSVTDRFLTQHSRLLNYPDKTDARSMPCSRLPPDSTCYLSSNVSQGAYKEGNLTTARVYPELPPLPPKKRLLVPALPGRSQISNETLRWQLIEESNAMGASSIQTLNQTPRDHDLLFFTDPAITVNPRTKNTQKVVKTSKLMDTGQSSTHRPLFQAEVDTKQFSSFNLSENQPLLETTIFQPSFSRHASAWDVENYSFPSRRLQRHNSKNKIQRRQIPPQATAISSSCNLAIVSPTSSSVPPPVRNELQNLSKGHTESQDFNLQLSDQSVIDSSEKEAVTTKEEQMKVSSHGGISELIQPNTNSMAALPPTAVLPTTCLTSCSAHSSESSCTASFISSNSSGCSILGPFEFRATLRSYSDTTQDKLYTKHQD